MIGKYWIKIPKKLRTKIASLSKGSQLEVAGSKQNSKNGKTKYKAKTVVLTPQIKESYQKSKPKPFLYFPYSIAIPSLKLKY